MIQRKEVVLSVLGELQEATESMGLDDLIKVALDVEQALSPFPLPTVQSSEIFSWLGIDAVAHRLYPDDAPVGLLPLACKGEGNLLFDAASMLLVGSTSLSLELQVRTVVEMLLWKQYYLSGMIDSKVMLQAARFSLCAEESQDMLKLPVQVLEAIFDADVKASCFPNSFANMWHIYALASVLQSNIYSIYPMYNLKIRPYFNRLIRPRTWPKRAEHMTLHIMWSGELEAGSIFKPHDFVALIHASDLKIGSPGSEQRLPAVKSLDLPHDDPQLSYSTLRDKLNITKSTYYRWRRQSMEYHKKSVARYEVKHFFQACYKEGRLIPQNQFRELFPEISRSTYYAWKHELMTTGSIGSTREVSPREGNEQDYWSSPKSRKQFTQETFSNLMARWSKKLEAEHAQNATLMQEAKRSLQKSIVMNTLFPYRIFKRKFPGISRSTYYNWRKEAVLHAPFKDQPGSGEESSDADKSRSPDEKLPLGLPTALKVSQRARLPRSNPKNLFYLQRKKLREDAKARVRRTKMSLFKFKLKFPSISSHFYWLWRDKRDKKAHLKPDLSLQTDESRKVEDRGSVSKQMFVQADNPTRFTFDVNMHYLKSQAASPTEFSIPDYPSPDSNNNEQMFMMDVVALPNFKAKAKLFLQLRYEEKSFPTFKEFRSYFPLTPRSTYYMWKRALHHGVPLVHGLSTYNCPGTELLR